MPHPSFLLNCSDRQLHKKKKQDNDDRQDILGGKNFYYNI